MIINFKWIFLLLLLFNSQYIFSKEPHCELIDYQVVCSYDGRKLVQEISRLIQINNRMGDKYAKIEIPFSKKERLSDLKAQIETDQGVVIRELKKSEITDRSAISDFSLYEDDFIKIFELKHNFYPYRIRYSYKYTFDEFLDIINWYPGADDEVKTRNARLEIIATVNYPVKYYSLGIPKISIDTVGSIVKYIFEISNFKLPEKETFCVPVFRNAPFARIVPVKFKWVYSGSHESWTEYGNWESRLIKGTDELPLVEKIKILDLVKGKTDKREIIKTLYRYLQDNTRYINVSIGVGGLKPYPAEYVANKKYGDCKALSIYMKALLKAVDINSHYTNIYAGENMPAFLADFPSQQANHVILCVPLEKDTLFLENTSNSIPMGYIGTSIQGREALLIDENNSRLIKTPYLNLNDVKDSRKFIFDTDGKNECSLKMFNTFKGRSFDYFNSVYTILNKKEIEDLLHEQYLRLSGFELLKWELHKPERDSAIIKLDASLKLHNYLKNYGTDLGLPLLSLNLPTFEMPAKRKLSLYFEYPVFLADSFIYNLPATLTIKVMPEEYKLSSKFGEYSVKVKYNDNKLTVYREFIIHRGEYGLGEYLDFYSFITNVLIQEKKLIILTNK